MKPILQFKLAKITPISLDDHLVEWELEKVAMDLTPYRFRIKHSRTAGPPFELVVENLPVTSKFYHDELDHSRRKLVEETHYVELYDPATSNVLVTSPGFVVCASGDVIGEAIIRKEHLILSNPSKGIGVLCYLFSLRNWGIRCTNCWDERKEKIKLPFCEVCYGSGFMNGYYDPIPFYMNISAPQSDQQLSEIGENTSTYRSAWTTPSPEMRPNDIVVVKDTNRRYRVVKQQTTIRRNLDIRQMLQLSELNRHGIEYKLPLP